MADNAKTLSPVEEKIKEISEGCHKMASAQTLTLRQINSDASYVREVEGRSLQQYGQLFGVCVTSTANAMGEENPFILPGFAKKAAGKDGRQ